LAKMLADNAAENEPNPNAMVGNQVVKISPFTAIANALSKGVASYQGVKAQNEQGQLEDEKRKYLAQALSGGGQITPEIIVNAGGDSDDLLKMAISQRMYGGSSGPVYDYLNTSKGVLRVDKRSKEAELLPYNMATADSALQGDISLQKNINKIGPVVGEDEATRYMTYGAAAGLPNNFEPALDATARVESGGNPNAISPAGAQGTYQIMPETAADPGYNMAPLPTNATEEQKRLFAAEYQLNMLKAHPEWTYGHVASAYNMGPGNVEKGRRNPDYERKIMGGVRSPTRQEKDAREIQKDVTKESLLAPIKLFQEQGKSDISVNETLNKAKAEQQAKAEDPIRIKGKQDVNDLLDKIESHYDELDKANAIQNPDKGALNNLISGVNSSDLGQYASNKLGTQAQSARNAIKSARSTLVPVIMRASGLTGSQINSEAELKQFMQSLTDPAVDIKSVKEQIETLRNLYGNPKDEKQKELEALRAKHAN